MDCPICFNSITNSAIGSCTHHFCRECLIKWCEFGGTKCPTCKMSISQIRSDQEFDALNITSSSYSGANNNDLTIDLEKNDMAGITLENHYSYLGFGQRGPGVVITKINEKGKCFKSGLHKGDILLSINNIPCIDHKQSIDIINNAVISSTRLTCEILKIKNLKE